MKEKIKENWFTILITILILLLVITGIYYNIQVYQVSKMIENENLKDLFEYKYVNYNAYEFQDGSWFVYNDNEYVFQPVELGDWNYELENKEQLRNIIATYFIYKYNVDTDVAIQEINKILEEVK